MPASDQSPSTAPKPRILPLNRILLLLILAAFIAILVVVLTPGGAPATSQAAPVITVAPPASAVVTPPAPVMSASAAPVTTPDVSAPQPAAAPTSAPSVVPAAPAAETTVPATVEAVAAQFGGSPDQWSKGPVERGGTVGPNGFIYRSHGTQQIHFVVPQGMVVDVGQQRFSAGAQIYATDWTVYWV